MARQRDYRAEYARRKAKGLAEGKTLAEARGHAAERKGRAGVSRELLPHQVPGYLDKLAARRDVKVVGYTADGSHKILGRGKPRPMADWFRDTLEEDTLGQSGYSGDEEIVMIRVFFS